MKVLRVLGLMLPFLCFACLAEAGDPAGEIAGRTAEVVAFPDPKLEAVIRQAIHKPTGDILDSDLLGLETLNAPSAGIACLSGIEHCVNLIGLELSNNQIADVSPLSNLTGLVFLYLNDNQVTDVRPLSNLTSLLLLLLQVNQIADVSPLSSLAGLMWLDLSDNPIVNVSPLSGLTQLTELWLASNRIADVSPLAGLTGLEALSLSDNQIADVNPLAGLTDLTKLRLDWNQIVDVNPLSRLRNLMVLNLSGNQVADLDPLSGLTALHHLYLSSNQVREIDSLLANSGLGAGDEILLFGNPLSLRACAEIRVLEARGAMVDHDPCNADGPVRHTADLNGDGLIDLSELLRLVQYYNSDGFHCEAGTDDGYAPGPGDTSCAPHAGDYYPQDWHMNLSELLRGIQFFNLGAYDYCPGQGSEDDFCPGSA